MDWRAAYFLLTLTIPLLAIVGDLVFYRAGRRGLPWSTLAGIAVLMIVALILYGG